MMNKKYLLAYGLIILSCIFNHKINAQCNDGTHSTNKADTWESCTTSISPNPARGTGHWLMYDLGYVYELTTTKFWNYNVFGETDKGFKNVVLDYSLDGINWTELSQFQISEATGMSDYIGFDGPHFNNITARYVLVFAEDTWGNSDNCAGLSELKIGLEGIDPPADDVIFDANPKTEDIVLNWTGINETEIFYFDIEKSLNGYDFVKINTLNGKGNRKSNEYVLLDKEVKKGVLYYYRLKIVNTDNSYKYSEVKSARLGRKTEIQLYPNPVSNVLDISLDGDISENIGLTRTVIVLLDSQGHELKRLSPQKNHIQLDVSFLPSGMYFITIIGENNEKETKRFIKVE